VCKRAPRTEDFAPFEANEKEGSKHSEEELGTVLFAAPIVANMGVALAETFLIPM
jgi:hypothetical protein